MSMKYICSTVNKTYGCNECPHGKPHDSMGAGGIYHKNGSTVEKKCTEKGYCYEGRHNRWECKCIPIDE